MTTLSISNLRKNIYNIISTTIKFNEPVHVNTKDGNAVILSEEEYNGIMETLYLSSIPGLKAELISLANDLESEVVDAKEVLW